MVYKNKLYELGIKIGLNKEEIDEIIQTGSDIQLTDSSKLTLQNPTDAYLLNFYGTVSIKDFQ